MKHRTVVGKTSIALLGALGIALLLNIASAMARAQNQAERGWIEGVVVDPVGNAASSGPFEFDEVKVTLKPQDGDGFYTFTDHGKGGFYTFRGLKPGVYEVFVDKSRSLNQATKQRDVYNRPQHIFGLVVEPDKRTYLKIVVHEGTEIEEIGKPNVVTQKAIIIGDELARLQKEIDALKK